MRTEFQEVQRYGRDKSTSINHSYIRSGEYRNKFDNISDCKELNRKVYQIAKKMLEHRSGTEYEDMYWVDVDLLKVIASETAQQEKRRIQYSKATKNAIKKHDNLLVIHTHPNSMPPSVGDLNSALKNQYQICLVCCHNGKLFMYHSNRYIIEFSYKFTIAKYKRMGYDEYDAQIMALKEYKEKGDISFKEV